MERTEKKLRLCAALLVVNVLFIWGNSLLPGSVSGAISRFVRDIIAFIFPGSSDSDGGHGLLRKLAHFTEFACLGALLAWLFGMLAKPFPFALPCAFLVACVDETIQRFVPDRGPGFKDVLIDTAGALVGIGLLFLGYTIRRKQAKQSLEDTKGEKMDRTFPDPDSGAVDVCLQTEDCRASERHDGGEC